MKSIFINYGMVAYCFVIYAGACVVLAIITIINLPSLFWRKEKL